MSSKDCLSPVHQGNELIWCGRVSIAAGFTCEYSYHVVDDNRNVLRWESGEKRKLVLPDGIQDGDVVEIRDWWQQLMAASNGSMKCLKIYQFTLALQIRNRMSPVSRR